MPRKPRKPRTPRTPKKGKTRTQSQVGKPAKGWVGGGDPPPGGLQLNIHKVEAEIDVKLRSK